VSVAVLQKARWALALDDWLVSLSHTCFQHLSACIATVQLQCSSNRYVPCHGSYHNFNTIFQVLVGAYQKSKRRLVESEKMSLSFPLDLFFSRRLGPYSLLRDSAVHHSSLCYIYATKAKMKSVLKRICCLWFCGVS
jgi:hypothetical protein